MSTATQTQPAATLATGARGGTRLGYALHAEWTKLRTVSGPAWLLIGAAALTIAVSTAAVGATRCPRGVMCPVDTTKLSLTGVQSGQAVIAILAVLVISNEYSTGMIRVTLAAMPRRHAVLAAKAILVTALVLVTGAVAVFGSVLAGHLILPGHGVLALLYLFPILLAFIGNAHWQHRLERWTPTVAGLTIQDTTGLRSLAITPWAGLGVLALWAAGALLAGGLAFRLRDA